jgi:hypothetical protein
MTAKHGAASPAVQISKQPVRIQPETGQSACVLALARCMRFFIPQGCHLAAEAAAVATEIARLTTPRDRSTVHKFVGI